MQGGIVIRPEHEAGIAFDEERNDRAGQAINAATDAARAALADKIERGLALCPDTEIDLGEVVEMTGASVTQCRGALALLVSERRVVTVAGEYYSAPVAS
jgi:DNA-binding GntR family transcriptional regulator